MLVEKDSAHANDIAGYPALGVVRSAADLALQPCLGVLPKRRFGNSPDHRDHLDAAVKL